MLALYELFKETTKVVSYTDILILISIFLPMLWLCYDYVNKLFLFLLLIFLSFCWWNMHINSYLYQIISEYVALDMVLISILLVSWGNLIGWSSIFDVIKQPSSFKRKFANRYLFFLIGVLNHSYLPPTFIAMNLSLGAFLGKQLISVLQISPPTSFVIIFTFPFLTSLVAFSLSFGFYLLCLKYPITFGKVLVNFLKQNADQNVLNIVGLKKPSVSKIYPQVKENKKSRGNRYYSNSPSLTAIEDGTIYIIRDLAISKLEGGGGRSI